MYITGSSKKMSLIPAILLIFTGVIFIAYPDMIATASTMLFGVIVTTIGFIRVISLISYWQFLHNRTSKIIVGLLILGVGLFILINPARSISLIGIVIGIIAIVMAINRFVLANSLKSDLNVAPIIITGLIHLAFGLAMIYAAIVVISVIITIVGVYLLTSGVMLLLSALNFRFF